ncbi:hypothetical protein [Bradyrhizobium prioriisuperbiae]|uniref:hypothetical protein n=1 Tax=Bradyrhizobium prioriisuperbiae TaxID=2854389 RepID=UPI0028E73328|nr:hypothetical protein [Bradyrhizobium prioritasuperba]
MLAVVGVAGAVAAGAVALARTFSFQEHSEAADLQPAAPFPASNATVKADKLAVGAPIRLASLSSTEVPEPRPPRPSPVNQYAALDTGAVAALDGRLPADLMKPSVGDQPKPKAAAVKPAKPTNVILNDAQIASLKQRLRLSASQEQYWPELEVALRAVVKQIYEANKKSPGKTVPVDTSTPEVERLKTAAMPLLMQMRSDQKTEVIMLARIIGMEKLVAML